MITGFIEPLLEMLKALVNLAGPAGILISMVVQAIIVIIPSEGVIALAGAFMPLWEVYVWATIGSLLGASASFFIAKKGGRPIIKRLLGKDSLNFMDAWVKKWGDKSVLIGRLIPFIPYDPISYLSGITSMKFKSFTKYNIMGTIPRVIFYATLGSVFTAYETLGIIIFAAFAIGLLGASIYTKKKMSQLTKEI